MTGMKKALIAISALSALCACEEETQRSGLPACEPAEELILERGLKEGFRALGEHDHLGAKTAFQEVLAKEAGHPEARAGLRQANLMNQNAKQSSAHEGLLVGEHEVQTQQKVDHHTLRLEVRAQEHAIARRNGHKNISPPKHIAYRRGEDDATLSNIDLLVLHTSGTVSALERFVELQHEDQEAHFIIDWDGRVYQTLDLARVAKHAGSPDIDSRSLAIELVAPRDPQQVPLPKEAKGLERSMSPRVRVQGKLMRSWGFTKPQMKSLKQLVEDLTRLLPDLESTLQGGRKVPLKALNALERKTVTGIVGALHINPESTDPGPGFDWSELR